MSYQEREDSELAPELGVSTFYRTPTFQDITIGDYEDHWAVP
jgi:hypothetical protein